MFSRAIALVGIVAILSGCLTENPVCNTPYILVGNGCCLDENGDNICDRDKPVTTTTTTSTTTTSSTTTTTSTTFTTTTLQYVPHDEYIVYTSSLYGVSIKYPLAWSMTEQAKEDEIVGFYSPEDGNTSRGAATVKIVYGKFTVQPSAEDFAYETNAEQKKLGVGYMQTSVTNDTIDGKITIRHAYTAKEGKDRITVLEYIVYYNTHTYAMTYKAQTPLYEKYLPIFQNMTESAKIG
ncbi:MAG: hypothetical protein V1875_07690 [Candidatus Altiarchaeota archaeon]